MGGHGEVAEGAAASGAEGEAATAADAADGAAWIAALGAAVPPTDDPWLAPAAGLAVPPELELLPRDPR